MMQMKFYEKNLEDLIWDNLQDRKGIDMLYDRGFPVPSPEFTIFRQFNIGSYGVIDLLAISPPIKMSPGKGNQALVKVRVYELKREKCDASAVVQLSRYMTGLKHLFVDKIQDLIPSITNPESVSIIFTCFLVGTEISQDAMLLLNSMPDVSFVGFNFSLENGLDFKEDISDYQHTGFDPYKTDISLMTLKGLMSRSTRFNNRKRRQI